MYQSPIPVDKDKQCSDCKNCDYDGGQETYNCLSGFGYGQHSTVQPGGTCEYWEKQIE